MAERIFENVKPGDTVGYDGRGWRCRAEPVKVQKVTKTQVVVSFGATTQRFNRSTGRRVGRSCGFGHSYIVPWTEELAVAWRRSCAIDKLKHFNKWDDLSNEALGELAARLRAFEREELDGC